MLKPTASATDKLNFYLIILPEVEHSQCYVQKLCAQFVTMGMNRERGMSNKSYVI